MPTPAYPDSEALLAHVGWVRSLARRLVRDASAAEDLAQDALVVALERAPREAASLRGWLASVLRNLSRTRVRSEERRAQREAGRGGAEAPSTLELVERAATQRELVGALLELDEPYRSVLLLRYFEGLEHDEIARRTGVSSSTVSTRLARAEERLRRKWLARSQGDRRERLSALAALAELFERRAPAAAWKLALPAVALGLAAAGVWNASGTSGSDPVERRDVAEPSLDAVDPVRPPADFAAYVRERLLPSAGPAERPDPGAAAAVCPWQPVTARGRVIDLDGRALAGIEVSIERFQRIGDTRIVSDQEGRLTFQARAPARLHVAAPGWVTVLAGQLEDGDGEPLLVAARAAQIAGCVVDAAGRAQVGAEIGLLVPEQALRRLGEVLDASIPVPLGAVAGDDGRFRLDAPAMTGLALYVRAAGFEPARIEVPPESLLREDLRIVVTPIDAPSIHGEVVDPAGRSVAGALVSAGAATVASDAGGRFALPLGPAEREAEHLVLHALHNDLGAVRRDLLREPDSPWTGFVRLELAGRLLSISGRVLDTRGAPVPGVQLVLRDETPFGLVSDDRAPRCHLPSVEGQLGGTSASTDARGEFALPGLLERSYSLELLLWPGLQRVVSTPIPAGSVDVTLVFDPPPATTLEGRVVDRSGKPVPGVLVAASCEFGRHSFAIGRSVTTDEEGRFRLADVASEGLFLRLDGPAIVPLIRCELVPGLLSQELVVSRRAHLQLDWGDWEARADELRLLGADGAFRPFLDLVGNSVTPLESIPVGTGLSSVYAIPEDACSALLYQGGEEVARIPFTASSGRVERVQL